MSDPLTYPQQVAALGPVHWWRLGGEGPWEDSVGGATATGALSGTAPQPTPGLIADDDGALRFANGQTVRSTIPAPGNAWTLSCIISTTNETQYVNLISEAAGFDPRLSLWPTSILVGSGGASPQFVGSWRDGNAHLVVGTFDGTGLQIFGDDLQSTVATGGTGYMNPLTLDFGRTYTGVIDEVAIFDRALSAAEVAALWAAVPVPAAPQDLTATAGWRSATVSWTPPPLPEGTEITEYVVEVEPVGA